MLIREGMIVLTVYDFISFIKIYLISFVNINVLILFFVFEIIFILLWLRCRGF